MLNPESTSQQVGVSRVPGRYVVTFDSPTARQTSAARTGILEHDAPNALEEDGYSLDTYFPRLGIAVVDGDEDQVRAFAQRCHARSLPLRYVPEQIYYALAEPTAAPPPPTRSAPGYPSDPPYTDTAEHTWGQQAVNVIGSEFTGKGIGVAVLDTGFDAAHPDFAGRDITVHSFVEGEDATDGHGHGTHCIGTACGPRSLSAGRGYGMAPGAKIYAGKVLGEDGSGSDSQILAGINWALENDCQVISMSLGADVAEIHPPYVAAGRRALELGTLIVAAAGNNAERAHNDPGFVGAPGNSPHIMAVAAVDNAFAVADFSARTLEVQGGQIDIAAPGVDIYSSWPGDKRYNTISGTSMATPHVAGIAAVLAEATGTSGRSLWAQLVQISRRLKQYSVDVGAGVAQAPRSDEDASGKQ